MLRATAAACLLLLTAATGLRAQTQTEPLRCGATCADTVSITYLGVGGMLIRHGEDAILTAPFFSIPSFWDVLSNRPVRTDTARVDSAMATINTKRVRALLVGHSHYDHLLDVPYIAKRHLPENVHVYGNAAMLNILHSETTLRPRLHAVEGLAGDWRSRGVWIYPDARRRVRFMALRSGHAPHLLGINLLPDDQHTPLDRLPRAARDWAQGQVFAFLIDFLDKAGRVVFRVHYQDSGSKAPAGFPPPLTGASAARIDVALVCAASYKQVKPYPEGLLRAFDPHYAVLGHSEDFLLRPSPDRDPPFTDVSRLVSRIDGVLGDTARSHRPRAGDTLRFCVCAPGEAPRPVRRRAD